MKKSISAALGFIILLLAIISTSIYSFADTTTIPITSYTSSKPASTSYPDTNNIELTDGKFGTTNYTDSAWQGRTGVTSYYHIVKLSNPYILSSISMNFLQNTTAGIYWPTSLNFYYSTDGITYYSLGTSNSDVISGSIKKFCLKTNKTAKYIKIVVNNSGNWVFSDEIEVNGTEKPIISGSIVQPYLGEYWSLAKWQTEFGYMKDSGMDHIILQWSLNNTPNQKRVYYPSTKYNSSNGYTYSGNNTLLNILTAAESKNMDVWIGLSWNEEWWTSSKNSKWLINETTIANNMISEIKSLGYLNKKSFKGWYSAWEIDNYNFANKTDQDILIPYLRSITSYIRKYANKPIMCSPFFNETLGTPAQWTSMWTNILNTSTGADFDIISLQDGIGVGHCSVLNIGSWLSATKKAVATHPGCSLYANVETFETSSNVRKTANINRIVNQIDSEAKYVDKITSFSFNHYQSPNTVAKSYFDEWLKVMLDRIKY